MNIGPGLKLPRPKEFCGGNKFHSGDKKFSVVNGRYEFLDGNTSF